jgi:hypothetical protein
MKFYCRCKIRVGFTGKDKVLIVNGAKSLFQVVLEIINIGKYSKWRPSINRPVPVSVIVGRYKILAPRF